MDRMRRSGAWRRACPIGTAATCASHLRLLLTWRTQCRRLLSPSVNARAATRSRRVREWAGFLIQSDPLPAKQNYGGVRTTPCTRDGSVEKLAGGGLIAMPAAGRWGRRSRPPTARAEMQSQARVPSGYVKVIHVPATHLGRPREQPEGRARRRAAILGGTVVVGRHENKRKKKRSRPTAKLENFLAAVRTIARWKPPAPERTKATSWLRCVGALRWRLARAGRVPALHFLHDRPSFHKMVAKAGTWWLMIRPRAHRADRRQSQKRQEQTTNCKRRTQILQY